MKALVEQKDAKAAVRWARGVVAVDPDAVSGHALLADMLYAAEAYQDAVTEYRTALAGEPDDAALAARAQAGGQEGRSLPSCAGGARRPPRKAASRAKPRTPGRGAETEGAAAGEGEGGQRGAARRRQRRASRLPSKSRSCIASARSPSTFRRPSSSGCIGGMVRARKPSNVVDVDAAGSCAAGRR